MKLSYLPTVLAMALGVSGVASTAVECDGDYAVLAGKGVGVGTAASACQYSTTEDQDSQGGNDSSSYTVNTEAFFGVSTWQKKGKSDEVPVVPLTQTDTPPGGTWGLPLGYSCNGGTMLVFKSGSGTRLVAYLLYDGFVDGIWTTPHCKPPFSFGGQAVCKALSHLSVYCSDDIQPENPPDGGPPTCTDGELNGDETGVDCGGNCPPCQTEVPQCEEGTLSQGNMAYVGTSVDEDTSPNIVSTFTASEMSPNANADSWEAVVFAGTTDGNDVVCDYKHILGTSSANADTTIPNSFTPAVDTWESKFGVAIDTSGNAHTVTIDTDFDDMSMPGYSESVGVGTLNICVELQQHVCGRKKEFVTVAMQVVYQLDDRCDDVCPPPTHLCEACAPVALVQKEDPVQVDVGADAPEIQCRLDNAKVGDNVPFTQSEIIKVCLEYIEKDKFDDACFENVLEFEATIEGGSILNSANLLALPHNHWSLAGSGTTCGNGLDISDQASSGDQGLRECCTSFMPDGRIFQEMEVDSVYNLNIAATVRSTYQCGDGTGPATRHLKGSHLEAVDRDLKADLLSYVEASFSLIAEKPECKNIFCWIWNLLLSLFGL